MYLGLIGIFLTSTYIWRGLAPMCYNLEYYLSDSWKCSIESLPAGRKRKDDIIGVLRFLGYSGAVSTSIKKDDLLKLLFEISVPQP